MDALCYDEADYMCIFGEYNHGYEPQIKIRNDIGIIWTA